MKTKCLGRLLYPSEVRIIFFEHSLCLQSNDVSYRFFVSPADHVISDYGDSGLVSLWNVVKERSRSLQRAFKLFLHHSNRRVQAVLYLHSNSFPKDVSFTGEYYDVARNFSIQSLDTRMTVIL